MTSQSVTQFPVNTEQETTALARRVAEALQGGEYISLEGDLGAGKTFFARELIHSLGVADNVTSPTFLLQKIYSVSNPNVAISDVVHYDFYRIGSYYELLDLGFEDHQRESIVLAEWGNLFLDDFPVRPIRIHLKILSHESRLISVTGLNSPRFNLLPHT